MSGEIRFEAVEVLGYEGRWSKGRLKGEGETSWMIEYFAWESGKWQVVNLVGGMTEEAATRLKVPKALWPTEEELEEVRRRSEM